MKVLVILASYNGEKYIQEQIESILLQKEVDVQIVVFDDVSTDKTLSVVSSLIKDERIKIVKNPVSTGSAANNFFGALKYLKQDFIMGYDFVSFADQDDIWLPEKLFFAVNMLTKENSSLYFSNLVLWNEKNNKKSIIKKNYPQKKYDFLFEGGSAGCTYVFTNDFCISLKNTLKITDYTNWNFFSHDWFVYFFARANCFKVSMDSNAYILYRIHDSNVHGQLNTKTFFAFKERLKLVRNGWYLEQIEGFRKLLPVDSKGNKIYELYSKNILTRTIVLLKYNKNLMRSSIKFIQFLLVSLLPIRTKN